LDSLHVEKYLQLWKYFLWMIFQYDGIILQQAVYVKSVYVLPSLSPSLTKADINSISLFCVNAVSSGSTIVICIIWQNGLQILSFIKSYLVSIVLFFQYYYLTQFHNIRKIFTAPYFFCESRWLYFSNMV
jgi:hypothetical protein